MAHNDTFLILDFLLFEFCFLEVIGDSLFWVIQIG